MAGQAICCNKNNMIDMEVKYNLLGNFSLSSQYPISPIRDMTIY